MSKTEILAELPKIPRRERREIMDRILELDDQTELLEERRRSADEAFVMLDELEAADAANQTR